MCAKEVAFSLMSATPRGIYPDRCLKQRHYEADCHYCLDACLTKAIQIEQSEIIFSEDKCVGCGACLVVCPVECFETEDWSERALISTLERIEQPAVEFVCKWHPEPHQGKKAVPVLKLNVCLAAVSPGLWFEIGSKYAVGVRLDSCEDCILAHLARYVKKSVELSISWLESCGQSHNLKILEDDHPPVAPVQRPVLSAESPILNRRDFLFAFVRSSGQPSKALSCLPVEESSEGFIGKLPPHQPAWLRQLAAIFPKTEYSGNQKLSSEVNETVEQPRGDSSTKTRQCASWPALTVSDNCTACKICSSYCPSGALATREVDGKFTLFFIPGVCVACGLCSQACPTGSIIRCYSRDSNPFNVRVVFERPATSCTICGNPTADTSDELCYWCKNEPTIDSLLDAVRDSLLGT